MSFVFIVLSVTVNILSCFTVQLDCRSLGHKFKVRYLKCSVQIKWGIQYYDTKHRKHARGKNMYCRLRFSYQVERVGIPLTCLTHVHFYASPKSGPGIPTSYMYVKVYF